MRLAEISGEKYFFDFSVEETDLLLFVLNDYPLVPEAHMRLRKKEDPEKHEDQKLLDDALRAQRVSNKQQLHSLLNEKDRFAAAEGGFRAGFVRGEIELLLQVLNDVRIGSWIALGSPDYDEEEKYVKDKKSLRFFITMQICGDFQSILLKALHGGPPPAKK